MELILFFVLFVYFIPSMVAYRRKHRNRASIVVLNTFLGWSAIGWVISLVWAYSCNVERELEQGVDYHV